MRSLGRKLLAVLLSLIFVSALPLSVSADVITEAEMPPKDEQVVPMFLNCVDINLGMEIVGDRAEYKAWYTGINGVTTSAVIELVLQKKVLLWWSDVGSTYIHNFNTVSNSCFHSDYLEDYGEYRVCAYFTISGTSGSDDTEYKEVYATYSAPSDASALILLAPTEVGRKELLLV